MMFIYLWLNYCDENHSERIPIAIEYRSLFSSGQSNNEGR